MATANFMSNRDNAVRLSEADQFAMAKKKEDLGSRDGATSDITAPQKMISAMSGSLLTSLLGTLAHHPSNSVHPSTC